MDREQVIARLRVRETELRAAGVAGLAVFGSIARGDADPTSDVDVVIRLSPGAAGGGFAYFGRLAALAERLRDILECPVDVVAEPVRKDSLRRQIEKEAVLAF